MKVELKYQPSLSFLSLDLPFPQNPPNSHARGLKTHPKLIPNPKKLLPNVGKTHPDPFLIQVHLNQSMDPSR